MAQEEKLAPLVDAVKLGNLQRVRLDGDQPRPRAKEVRDVDDAGGRPQAGLVVLVDEAVLVVRLVDPGEQRDAAGGDVIGQNPAGVLSVRLPVVLVEVLLNHDGGGVGSDAIRIADVVPGVPVKENAKGRDPGRIGRVKGHAVEPTVRGEGITARDGNVGVRVVAGISEIDRVGLCPVVGSIPEADELKGVGGFRGRLERSGVLTLLLVDRLKAAAEGVALGDVGGASRVVCDEDVELAVALEHVLRGVGDVEVGFGAHSIAVGEEENRLVLELGHNHRALVGEAAEPGQLRHGAALHVDADDDAPVLAAGALLTREEDRFVKADIGSREEGGREALVPLAAVHRVLAGPNRGGLTVENEARNPGVRDVLAVLGPQLVAHEDNGVVPVLVRAESGRGTGHLVTGAADQLTGRQDRRDLKGVGVLSDQVGALFGELTGLNHREQHPGSGCSFLGEHRCAQPQHQGQRHKDSEDRPSAH